MQPTELLQSMQVESPKSGPAAWWRRRRVLLLPQIILLAGVIALAGGGLLAVWQYARHSAELRSAETNRLLGEVRSGPVAAAWERLAAAWRAEGARSEALLARLASPDQREVARVRRDHRMLVLETVEQYHLQPDIEVVRRFVVRLATCVRIGACDRDAVAARLGPALWAFHDQHRQYFLFEYSGMNLVPYLETIAPRRSGPAAAGGRPGRRGALPSSAAMPGRGGAGASGARSPRAW
jgi:hypothetical protein